MNQPCQNLPSLYYRLRSLARPYYENQVTRTYHNWAHIEQSLNAADEMQIGSGTNPSPLPISVVVALIFHDIVYVPGANINEAYSAVFMRNTLNREGLKGLVSMEDMVEAEKMILATAEHFLWKPTNVNTSMVMDADLVNLGTKDYDNFIKVQLRVLEEYSHVPVSTRTAGQKRLLGTLLKRKTVYRSNPKDYPVIALWEQNAQHNLRKYCAGYY